MKTIKLVVELINVPDECTAEKFKRLQEDGDIPCIAEDFGSVAARMGDKELEDLKDFQFGIEPYNKEEL